MNQRAERLAGKFPGPAFSPAHRRLAAALLGGLSAICGCAASSPPVERPRLDPLDPRVLYPLHDGYIWSYMIDTGTDMPVFTSSSAVETSPGSFELTPQGGQPRLYELRPEGIYRTDVDVWLLRAPIAVGANWPSTGGRTATVTSISEEVDVRAGRFQDCVEVAEEGGTSHMRIRTVYCPELGPAIVESTQTMELSGQDVSARGELVGLERGEEGAESPEPYDSPGETD